MMQKLKILFISIFLATAIAACGKEIEIIQTSHTKNKITEALQDVEYKEDPVEITSIPVEIAEPSPTTALTEENEDYYVIIEPIIMTAPPTGYYISANAKAGENSSIQLKLKSTKPNEISDEYRWFQNNELTLNELEVPNPNRTATGNLPDEIDAEWKGLRITKAFYDDSFIYCTYGSDFWEGYIMNVYDAKSYQLINNFDFSDYRYSPEYIADDYNYIQQRINWATIKDNILYISHSHNTYAESSNYMNAYITAIDLADMGILWRTEALVCNSYNFLIIDDVIICGYGFTDEPDYLNQINLCTGEVFNQFSLITAPSYLIVKDDVLYVRTYNTDYEFDIIH